MSIVDSPNSTNVLQCLFEQALESGASISIDDSYTINKGGYLAFRINQHTMGTMRVAKAYVN